MHFGRGVDDRRHGAREEVGELELDYGPPTVERESDGSSGECSLGDGRVENAAAGRAIS